MSFTLPTDYKAYYQIAVNSKSEDKLQDYIDDIEPEMLRDLLGIELYDLFIADLDTNGLPQSARFQAIFNPFYTDEGSGQEKSQGIKVMLKGFVYYSYVADSPYVNTLAGNVSNSFSNSKAAYVVESGLYDRYNLAIDTYQTIQWYICENSATYPEYNGQDKTYLIWL